MHRRAFLHAGALAAAAALADEPRRAGLGVVAYCFSVRRAAEPMSRLGDPLGLVEHSHAVGAVGVQTSLGTRDADYCARLRDRLSAAGMYLEGIVRLPRDQADVERFEAELRTARDCGATVLRTALLEGRRYETFMSAADFRDFRVRSRQALALARPGIERYQLRLAIENHKDWRAGEHVELLREVRSPLFGACIDTGNNLALLETPDETVEALAPFAFTTHLKDMGVAEYPEGFLLAEVPLGAGLFDLPRVVQRLRQANPAIRFNLEMITRDPLRIPCLTSRYWATLEDVPGRRLAEALSLVRRRAQELPRLSDLPPPRRVEREDDNVRRSLRHARDALGL